jgi:large subunit ribosomal protein L4
MELVVYNINGQKTSKTVTLDESIFCIEPNDHAIYLDAKQYLANQRQGTHASKEKWAVSRSTRKLKKQKGTGGARGGSLKNPLVKGGGRIFGPQPRDYHFKLNKKLKQLARKSALAYKVKENQITILEDFTFDSPKTKSYIEMLKQFKLEDKKTLLVINNVDLNVIRSSNNLQKAKVLNPTDLNTYDILNANHMLITEASVKEIERVTI